MYQPYPSTQPQQIRPSLGWVWGGVGLIVLSIVVFFSLVVINVGPVVSKIEDGFVLRPGQTVTAPLAPDSYAVFVEYGALNEGRPSVDIVGPDGALTLSQFAGTETYTGSNFTGEANFGFTVDTAAEYQITNNGSGRVAIGPRLLGDLMKAFLIPFLIGTVMGIAGIVMIIVTLVRRRSSRRRLTYGNAPAAPYPGAPQAGYGPGPGYSPTPGPGYPPGQGPGYPPRPPQPPRSPQ